MRSTVDGEVELELDRLHLDDIAGVTGVVAATIARLLVATGVEAVSSWHSSSDATCDGSARLAEEEPSQGQISNR